ncbi:lactonase family protein [Anatilimnocola floriformis]|uniref:lactonase family protein n=1 Tax=Anatilimnocola floriformis TaxID=2948575 RepID=UPI0020C2DEBB|nr:lactonase family protein [Anatilimnocola floriformis]
MTRALGLLLALLLAGQASGQGNGISLLYRDPQPVKDPAVDSGQLAVSDGFVTVIPADDGGQPKIFDFEGKLQHDLRIPTIASAVFAGRHLYLLSRLDGLKVIDTDTWKEVQTVSAPGLSEALRVQATPDGTTIFALRRFAPASLFVFQRDAATGKLDLQQVFQSDESSLALARSSAQANPAAVKIRIEKDALRVPSFSIAESLSVTPDSKHLYVVCYTNSLLVFGRDSKGKWGLLDSTEDNLRGHHTMGLMMCRALTPLSDGVIVGGIRRLAWFGFDGQKLQSKNWWVDDGKHPGHGRVEMPFLDDVTSLTVSQNEKYLFLASKHEANIQVLEITKDELKPYGNIIDAKAGAKMLDVAISPDGTRLFAKSTANKLTIYKLDERFRK